MKISKKLKNSLLNKKGTIFEVKGKIYKKDKDLFLLENNIWVKLTYMNNFSINDVKIIECANPYIFSIFEKEKNIYFHLYTNENIKLIDDEWTNNHNKTIKELYSFYSDYVKEFKKRSKINNLEIHKINFITNDVVEIIDNSILRKIYDIRLSCEDKKIPLYMIDHYCRNVDESFYFIYIKKINNNIINMIKKDNMFNNEKIHYNKTGFFIKSKEKPSEEELFYLKLLHSELKYEIFKCKDLKISLQD